jgi:hypothetical protein
MSLNSSFLFPFLDASGRFHFTNAECMAIASSCRSPLGRFESIWPTPAGGMKLNRIDEMRRGFGDDTLFLIGGALLEQGHDLEKDAQLFAHCCGRDQPYSPVGSNITSQNLMLLNLVATTTHSLQLPRSTK